MRAKPITIEAVLRGLEKRTFPKGEETWKQWLEKVHYSQSAEELCALFHRGFSATTSSVDEEIERIKFYFSAASLTSRDDFKVVEKIIYTTLCNKFLMPFIQNPNAKLGLAENLYLNPQVLVILVCFYTEEMVNAIQFCPSMGGKYAWETTSVFLEKFATWHGAWNSRMDIVHLWAISILRNLGKLTKLYRYDYFYALSDECLVQIRDTLTITSKSEIPSWENILQESDPLTHFYLLVMSTRGQEVK